MRGQKAVSLCRRKYRYVTV